MENIIKMVVSIDQKANDIIKQTEEYLETREKDIKEKIKAMRSEIMNNTKNEAKSLYESIVKEAEEEAEKIKSKTKEQCTDIENKFTKIKHILEKQLFSKIFS